MRVARHLRGGASPCVMNSCSAPWKNQTRLSQRELMCSTICPCSVGESVHSSLRRRSATCRCFVRWKYSRSRTCHIRVGVRVRVSTRAAAPATYTIEEAGKRNHREQPRRASIIIGACIHRCTRESRRYTCTCRRSHLQLAWNHLLGHQTIQLVHPLRELGAVDVHRRDDAAEGRDHLRHHHRPHQHQQARHDLLRRPRRRERRRGDVAVADGRDRHHGIVLRTSPRSEGRAGTGQHVR